MNKYKGLEANLIGALAYLERRNLQEAESLICLSIDQLRDLMKEETL